MNYLAIFGFPIFILGAIIGSFLNVVILRSGIGKERRKRSICLSCGKNLFSRDLVPIVSFFLLKGRCRHCKSKISWQYPSVEIATGILFVFSFIHAQNLFSTSLPLAVFDITSLFVICSTFVVIFVYDLRHKIINNLPVIILCLVAVSRVLVFHIVDFGSSIFFLDLISGPVSALPFFILWFISSGKWMGFGDVKLMLGIGWFVGWSLWISSIIFGFWLGAGFIFILFLLGIIKKITSWNLLKNVPVLGLKSEIPFGPFLIMGAFVSFFFSLDVFSVVSVFFL